jgi:hypothetical protein
MYAYVMYEIDKLETAEMNRRAEINRWVADARRERRAERRRSARSAWRRIGDSNS